LERLYPALFTRQDFVRDSVNHFDRQGFPSSIRISSE
jgi:hypothetical protein